MSGFIGLSYEVIYQRAFSLINGDLYTTYAVIVLTFIIAMAVGNLSGFFLRRFLFALELLGGIFTLVFGLWLAEGSLYTLYLPNIILIAILAVPAFIIGAHVPIYAYYLRQRDFNLIYFIYHLGAVVSMLLLEVLIFPQLPLSRVFIFLGSLQLLIGLLLALAYKKQLFKINHYHFDFTALKTFASSHWHYLVGVGMISVLSYFYHFMVIRLLLFYQFLVRPVYAYFLIISIFYLTLGAYLSSKKSYSLIKIIFAFTLNVFLVIFALAKLAPLIANLPFAHLNIYFLLLDLLALSPLLFSTMFFCQVVSLICRQKQLIDLHSGVLLAISSVGNLLGFFLSAIFSHWLGNYAWLLFILMVTLFLLWFIAGETGKTKLLICSLILISVGSYQFANYDLGSLLSEALRIKKFVQRQVGDGKPQVIAGNPLDTYAKFSQHHQYQLQDLTSNHHSLVGTFEQITPASSSAHLVYIVDGYLSHLLDTHYETLVGLLPQMYFPKKLTKSLVIGIGTGQTVSGTAMISEHTSAVDISPAVFAFLPKLSFYNHDLVNNQAVELIDSDGMNYLKQNSGNYQLILNTATNMFTHGVAKLHTVEFLDLVKKHLTTDGVYVSWLDSSGVKTHAQLEQIINLHRNYFNYLDVYFLNSGYALLVSYQTKRELRPLSAELLDEADQAYLASQGFVWKQLDSAYNIHLKTQAKTKAPLELSKMDYPKIEINALESYLRNAGEKDFYLSDQLIGPALFID